MRSFAKVDLTKFYGNLEKNGRGRFSSDFSKPTRQMSQQKKLSLSLLNCVQRRQSRRENSSYLWARPREWTHCSKSLNR